MRFKLLLVFLPLLVTVKAEELINGDPIDYKHVEPIHRIPRPLPEPILIQEIEPSEDPILIPSTVAQPESTPLPPPLPVKRPIPRPVLRPVPQPQQRPVPQPIPLPEPQREPEPQPEPEPQLEPEIQTELQPVPQPEPAVTESPARPIYHYRPAARPYYRPAVRPPPRPVQTPAPQPMPLPAPTTPEPLPEPQTEPQPLPNPEPDTERPILRPAPSPLLPRPTVPRPVLRPAPRPKQPVPDQKVPRPIHPQPVPRPVITPAPHPKPHTTTPKPAPQPQPDPLPEPKLEPEPKPTPSSHGSYRPTPRPPKPVWTQKPVPVTTTKKPHKPAKQIPIEFNDDSGTPIDFNCVKDGFYSVAGECDSYIKCSKRTAMMYVCPDGLYFNKNARWSDYPCSIPSEVKCEAGAVIHEPQPTDQCPNQNGFFTMKDGDCSRYISCEYGLATIMQCPPGLAFNVELSACDWPENVPSCNPNVFQGFICPAPSPDEDPDWIYKYRHGKSCKYYIACQRGHPRLLSCDPGLAFDEAADTCIDDQLVTNCSN